MSVNGTIYGVALNDRDHLARMASAFEDAPYHGAPRAPVVYIKPRPCLSEHGAATLMPVEADRLETASALALLFSRDAVRVSPDEVWNCVGATCLALDVSLPETSFYRPPIAQRCRDGFLPIGAWRPPHQPAEIVTVIDGREAHRWPLSRLARSIPSLVAELSQFMTLRAGDVLLTGLPGDAPQAQLSVEVRVEAEGMPPLVTRIERAPA
jgi:5-oxopent-3-ene-1,2,5-tricarboxylate decarboxylase/2-hydroxyhepta-2,4-diene-1,7-dioate isomerase